MHCPYSGTAVRWIRVMLLSLAVIGARPAAAQFSGAIHTTLPDGTTESIFRSKEKVYFTGESQNNRANGLPDGRYYFQVTDPSGATLLSNDPAKCRQVVVVEGRIAGAYDPVTLGVEPPGTPLDATHCEHASKRFEIEERHEPEDRHDFEDRDKSEQGRRSDEVRERVSVQLGGAFSFCAVGATTPDIFCDTPNPGGEYKMWLIAQRSAIRDCNPTVNSDQVSLTFDRKCAKTHNFKIRRSTIAHVSVCKFNDANGDGLLNSGELPISGWPITATVPTSSNVTLRSDNHAGTSVTAKTDSTGCVSFAVSGIPDDKHSDDRDVDDQQVEDKRGDDDREHDKHVHDKHVTVTLTEGSETGWTQTAPANGVYDASGHSAISGPTTVSGAIPSTGLPAEGGVISVNLGPGDTVTAPSFGNTNPQCPDCSILGVVTVIKTATPNKLYTWGITKNVDKTEIDTTAGSGATFNYTVSVTHDAGTGSLLTGTITLINGDGSSPSVTLDLIDAVNNGGVCTIQDPNSGLYVSQVMNLTLNSFTQVSIPYRCSYANAPSPSTGTNTATATNASNGSIQYIGKATFDFSKASAVVDGSVTITDTIGGALGTASNTDPSPKAFTYSHTFTGDPSGTCTTHNNTASATTNTTATTTSASQSVKVCVTGAGPAIATTPSPKSVTLGTTPITLKDSAVLTGGVNPTGTITFTLIFKGATVDTETVTVSGDGTYNTPTGFTLPIAPSSVGTYQWNAAYSGDAHNSSASEINAPSEQVMVSAAAQPTIVTTPSPASVALGTTPTTLKDSAVLSGGVNPTGTITFTLIFNGATTVDTETVAVNGSGTYNTPFGFTLPFARSSAGTYQWNAAYSGDGNNSPVSEINALSEQVVVSVPSQPAIATTPNPTSATLGTTPITLKDSAVLSGGLNLTGTITFTLSLNGGPVVDTETVTVNGAGTYSTPTGFTLPIARSSAGTYQWNATYSGDSNNNAASESGDPKEQVVVSAPPQPTIVTTPNPTSATLGTTPITLTDSAVLSGGLKPTGTLTFTLIFNGATVDTETVTVNGAGTYNTPTGFTLPIARSSAGTYQWNATYSGDSNNNPASEINAAAEQVVVTAPPQTAIVTTPSPTSATLGTTPITLKDAAVLSGGNNPTGTITFTLILNGGTADTETVTVNGAGTYNTPTGFTLPIARSSAGTYQWNATYSGDAVNTPASEINAAAEQVVVSAPPQPAIATTPSPTSTTLGTAPITLTDSAVLSGGLKPTGTLTFTLIFNGATVDTETVTVNGAGTYNTPTGFTLPIARSSAGTYQWNATYSGDTNNNAASEINAASEQVVVTAPPATAIVTTPSPASVTLGPTPITLRDSAVLSGGTNPTGTITFTLILNGGTVDTETVTVNGDGTYNTPTGFTLPVAKTSAGTYQWNATYSGDAVNTPASEINAAAEQVVVSLPPPTAIATTPSPASVMLGTTPITLKDQAVLSGGGNPIGTITFTLFFNGGSAPVDTETVTVNGAGTYTTPTGFTLPVSRNSVGTYQWNATYSGDTINNPVSETNAPSEQVVVSLPPPAAIVTTPSSTTVTLGTTLITLKDTATLTGGGTPTGKITFTLILGAGAVDSEAVTVNGDGLYTTPTGFTLPTTGAVTGTYQWNAVYSGDVINSPAFDNADPGERVTVVRAGPAIATTPNPTSASSSVDNILKDVAVLSGGYFPTGTITFTLFLGTTAVDTETVTVSGNGTYTTPTGFPVPSGAAATYQWTATYSGDSNNNGVTESGNPNEQVVVTP